MGEKELFTWQGTGKKKKAEMKLKSLRIAFSFK